MTRSKKWFLTSIFIFFITFGFTQIVIPVKWKYSFSKKKVKIGEKVDLIFDAKIDKGFHIYSSDFDSTIGPLIAKFNFEKNFTYNLIGKIKPINSLRKVDEIFGGEVAYFENHARFIQTIKNLKKSYIVKGELNVLVCHDSSGQCINQMLEYNFTGLSLLPNK